MERVLLCPELFLIAQVLSVMDKIRDKLIASIVASVVVRKDGRYLVANNGLVLISERLPDVACDFLTPL